MGIEFTREKDKDMYANLGKPLATGYKLIRSDWTCSPDGNVKAYYYCPGIFTERKTPCVGFGGMHFCSTIEGCFASTFYKYYNKNFHLVKVSAYEQIAKTEKDGFIIYATSCLVIEQEITNDYFLAREDPLAVIQMESPDKEILKTAVTANPFIIKEIENPDDEIQIAAVRKNHFAIRDIESPCVEAQKIAFEKDASLMCDIKNVSKEVILYTLSLDGRNI